MIGFHRRGHRGVGHVVTAVSRGAVSHRGVVGWRFCRFVGCVVDLRARPRLHSPRLGRHEASGSWRGGEANMVDVLMGGHLGLREWCGAALAAGGPDERSKLGLERAIADGRHVGDLVLAVYVDASNTRVAPQRVLDDLDAARASEPARRDASIAAAPGDGRCALVPIAIRVSLVRVHGVRPSVDWRGAFLPIGGSLAR